MKTLNLKIKHNIISFLELTIGAILAAFAIEGFLVPNKIFDGGITGISMIISHFSGLSLGLLVFCINIPFFIIALKRNGYKFVARFAYAIALFSVMTQYFTSHHFEATEEIILGLAYGAVFLGTGVGLVLRGGGCLDGTEVIAILLNKNVSISTGQIILIFNAIIFAAAGLLIDYDRGMYSLLMYFISSKMIDIVETGLETTKSVMIVTNDGKEIADQIFKRLGRTVTKLTGKGFVSKDEKDILYCVITRAEIGTLRDILDDYPGSAFASVSEVSEVIGNHIKSNKRTQEN